MSAAFNPARRFLDQVVKASVKHGVFARREVEDRAIQIFWKLGIVDVVAISQRYPHQVSVRQLQRIMIAMVLARSPI